MLVYLIPALALLLALGGIAFAVMGWRDRDPRPAGGAGGVTAAGGDSGRLDADMERYDL